MTHRTLVCLVGLLYSAIASAQSGNFALNDGRVKFQAPPDWPVIMQKIEGTPQFIAFQVKDPADSGTNEATRVTVTTKQLEDASRFQEFFASAIDKAKQTPGYEQDTTTQDTSSLRYSGLNGKTRYQYREAFFLHGAIAVHIRCARPVLAATTKAWSAAYEQGCEQIIGSVKPR